MRTENESRYGNGGYKVVVVASVLFLMQFLMVFGRCYSRRLQHVKFEADDYVLVLATVHSCFAMSDMTNSQQISTFALCAIAITSTFPRVHYPTCPHG